MFETPDAIPLAVIPCFNIASALTLDFTIFSILFSLQFMHAHIFTYYFIDTLYIFFIVISVGWWY